MNISQLETPVAVVDVERMERNLAAMAHYAAAHSLRLRPHIKTHKSAHVAQRQILHGARGLTCATVRELEVAATVCDDLLFAYPVVSATQRQRVAPIADRARVTFSADSTAGIASLRRLALDVGKRLDVLIELDVGLKRLGAETPADACALAGAVHAEANLRYAGVMFFAGHLRARTRLGDGDWQCLTKRLDRTIDDLVSAGLTPQIVSGGSTPLAALSHHVRPMSEIRPGTYVFNDRAIAAAGVCTLEDCALSVVTTVVSTSIRGQAIVDAGSKALGREPMPDESAGWAIVAEHPDVVISALSEEHGTLDLSESSWRPRVGDRVRIIPNHACIVVHLNDEVVGVIGDEVVMAWRIDARGRQFFDHRGVASHV